MPEPSILITGGNGYLGTRLAETILQTSDYDVQLFVHARDADELSLKLEPLKERFTLALEAGRLHLLGGELSDENPFEKVEKTKLEQIIHSAAVTRFNVEEELANRVNIIGSDRLLSFASGCPELSQLQFLSTVYASGLRSGIVREEKLERASSFSNHYERSKWEAEQVIESKYSGLPVNIIRIATLISDNNNGVVSQQNAFHNTLKLFYYGLLSLFPGEKSTPAYFVTGDFVLSSIMAIFNSRKSGEIYHVCHRLDETATLEQLVETVFSTFETYPDFKTRRVLRPLWSDAESFDLLSEGIGSLSAGVMSQAISSVAPFARQLFAAKDFKNDKMRNLLGDKYQAPDPLGLIKNTAEYLANTKWGRLLQNAK